MALFSAILIAPASEMASGPKTLPGCASVMPLPKLLKVVIAPVLLMTTALPADCVSESP